MNAPDSTAPETVPLDEAGRLAADIECRSCGYNLRGVAMDGLCPECTTAVGRSVRGDLLQFSDPDWVERVARGANWFVGAIVGGIVAAVLVGIVFAVSLATAGAFTPLALIVLVVVIGALLAVQFYAYWLVTTPDPGRDESAQPFTPRAIARYLLLASTFIGAGELFVDPSLLTAFTGGGGGAGAPPVIAPMITVVVTLVSAGVGLVGIGALLVYARTLARRMPDDGIAQNTTTVMWGYLVPASLNAIVVAVDLALGATSLMFIGIAQGVISLPVLVFAIWGVVLVFQYRQRLRAAAAAARATWAAPAGAPVAAPAPAPSAAEDPAIRMLVPVGRSALAIAAGYVGLFAVLLVPAPVALVLGIAALRHLKRHPDRRGRGRAIFAIVMGAVFTIGLGVVVVAAVMP